MVQLHGILDIESVGLHGEGFAAALTIIDSDKNILFSEYLGCPAEVANGFDNDRVWIEKNVLNYLPTPNCKDPSEVRNGMWEYYMKWKKIANERATTFTLWADCGFPVETRFIAACIDENVWERGWESPYPLQEIATIRTALGMDPTLSYELPESERHNPIAETRYIAQKLIEWLDVLSAR